MKTAAIIAEYNPFHNGHKYQINLIRETTDADHIIIIMSGSFVQRGAPALLDKYARAKTALISGADAVFELPVRYSTACARDFALGAVSMLNSFGCVDYLCFGCEDPWLFEIDELVSGEIFSGDEFRQALKSGLKSGESFATARANAILSSLKSSPDADTLALALKSPNNILALEYILSLAKLKSNIKAVPIRRVGDSFGSLTVSSEYPSATALRSLLLSPHPEIVFERGYMPSECVPIFKAYMKESCLSDTDSFSALLSYAILQNVNSLELFLDGSTELANRLEKIFHPGLSWDETASALKTKNYTLTRVNRYLTHILLGIKKDSLSADCAMTQTVSDSLSDCPALEKTADICLSENNTPQTPPATYAHLLGMRRESSKLIARIKEHSRIPVFSSPKEIKNTMDGCARMMLKSDLRATDIYHIAQGKRAIYRTDYEVSGVFI